MPRAFARGKHLSGGSPTIYYILGTAKLSAADPGGVQAACPLVTRSIAPVTAIVRMIIQTIRFMSVASFRGLTNRPCRVGDRYAIILTRTKIFSSQVNGLIFFAAPIIIFPTKKNAPRICEAKMLEGGLAPHISVRATETT